jgi:Tol biopolymer transport system component
LISWSTDGSKFIYVDTALTVHLYSYTPGIAVLNSFRLDIKPDYARISPNGDYIAVSNKNNLTIYNRSGKQLGMKRL